MVLGTVTTDDPQGDMRELLNTAPNATYLTPTTEFGDRVRMAAIAMHEIDGGYKAWTLTDDEDLNAYIENLIDDDGHHN